MSPLSQTKELKRILREVEHKKEEAVGAGFDRLFLDAYHRSIRHYPVWANSAVQKRYIHPAITSPTARIVRNPTGDIFITEFFMGDKRYRIESQRKNIFFAYDNYYTMELFLNDEKKFALQEKHGPKIQGVRYYTLDIITFLGDEWVDDFKKIKEYQDAVEAELADEIATTADAELVSQLKKNFNIGSSEDFYPIRIPRFIIPSILVFAVIVLFTILISFVP